MMAMRVDSQSAADLVLQPSPVLLEAVLKVEQVVARLQNLQSTISGIQLSPVNPKHTRASKAITSTRAPSSKDCAASKENTDPTPRRDENRRKSLKYRNGDSKQMQPDQPLKPKNWKQWSSPANQVHDVISEILMASEFAKQIATLVAEALQDGPQKTQKPAADQIQEPKKKLPKDGKRRDISFPSKAQVQKTMSAKAPPSKPVNKFKAAFPSDRAAKLAPPAKLSRPKGPPSKPKCGSGSPHRRRISRANLSNSSSPNSLSPQTPHVVVHSPETKRERQKLFSSPSGSFRKSDGADDELTGPRRQSMNVTEIKGSLKPWKLTPTKGVLFSNPVYLESSLPNISPARPSPVRIAPTTGRRRSWLKNHFPKSQSRCSSEADKKLRSSASGNPLASSTSKVTFKREGPSKAATKVEIVSGSSKREQKARKVAPPSRYVEMVPLDGPQDSSLVSMLDVFKVRSPSRLPMSRLDANNSFTNRAALTDRRQEIVEDQAQCRASHSHAKSTPVVKSVASLKEGGSDNFSDKENAPLPSCAPNAAKFLRSMSSGHTLNRTLSRKNSAVALLQRAKGWMSSQVVRQGRVRELERFPETNGFKTTRRYSLPGQLQATTSSRRLSLPGKFQVDWQLQTAALPKCAEQLVSNSKTEASIQPSKTLGDMSLKAQPAHKFKVYFPYNNRVTPRGAYGQRHTKVVRVFKVRYPASALKPVFGCSLFPGSIDTFMPGPNQWMKAPSTLNLTRKDQGKPTWLQRAMDWIVSIAKAPNGTYPEHSELQM